MRSAVALDLSRLRSLRVTPKQACLACVGLLCSIALRAEAQNTVNTNGPNGSVLVTDGNGVGFNFAPSIQVVGGQFGPGGNFTFQANRPSDSDTGGSIFIGGSQRGDGARSKILLTGNTTLSTANPVGMVVNGANNVGIGLNLFSDPAARLEVNGDLKLSGSGTLRFADGTTMSTAASGSGGGSVSGVQNDGAGNLQLGTSGKTVSVGNAGNPFGAFNVRGPGGFVVSGLNLDPNSSGSPAYFSQLKNSAQLLTGWNYLGGPGEQDIISNRGGGTSGGFAFFDYTNDGQMVKLADLNAAGLSIPNSISLTGRLMLQGSSFMTFPDGTVQSTAWNGVLSGGDYAEAVDIAGSRETYAPGDLLMIDADHPGSFLKVAQPYSTLVSGVYATKPGLVGRRQPAEKPKDDEVPMAMMGIVPTKVSSENGPIHTGDLLVASSTPGYAMRGTDKSQMLGAIVGKALAPSTAQYGVIEALITLQ